MRICEADNPFKMRLNLLKRKAKLEVIKISRLFIDSLHILRL